MYLLSIFYMPYVVVNLFLRASFVRIIPRSWVILNKISSFCVCNYFKIHELRSFALHLKWSFQQYFKTFYSFVFSNTYNKSLSVIKYSWLLWHAWHICLILCQNSSFINTFLFFDPLIPAPELYLTLLDPIKRLTKFSTSSVIPFSLVISPFSLFTFQLGPISVFF